MTGSGAGICRIGAQPMASAASAALTIDELTTPESPRADAQRHEEASEAQERGGREARAHTDPLLGGDGLLLTDDASTTYTG